MPQVLPEMPRSPTDLLSQLLGTMHLSGMVMFRAEFREPWSIMTPGTVRLAKVLPFRTEHIIPFHVVASGGCWLQMPERDPVWLNAGDAVLMPYGASHSLGGKEAAASVPLGQLLPRPPGSADDIVVEHGGAGAGTSLICGFVQCDELLFNPLLRHLPELLHVSPQSSPADKWLASTIRFTATEASHPSPGSRVVLQRLTELMFVEILRKHMQDLPAGQVGWFSACNDPIAGAALKLLHAAPLHEWRLEGLAREVGVSRTVLVDRFKLLLGQPPIQYLAQWRLQLAAQQLKSGNLPVKTIADHNGYESEAAFSRAFKRHFGTSPVEWRKQKNALS